MIPRLHLFELEDQSWLPRRVRDFGTDYIHFLEARFGMHRPVVPLLAEALQTTGNPPILDLCSGGGGPVLSLVRDLEQAGVSARVTLSDRFPNVPAFERTAARSDGKVTFVRDSVDATKVPEDRVGFRTMFNAFHHFRPGTATAILRDAVEAGQPIGIFEVPERRLHTILPMLLTPLFVWLATPFIRPFSWLRLLLTYVVPIVPICCTWDALVSQLRAYSHRDLLDLAESLGSTGYTWRAGQESVGSIRVKITWLIGLPPGGGRVLARNVL